MRPSAANSAVSSGMCVRGWLIALWQEPQVMNCCGHGREPSESGHNEELAKAPKKEVDTWACAQWAAERIRFRAKAGRALVIGVDGGSTKP